MYRLAPVLKTIFHQCVISTGSKPYSDGSVLRSQSTKCTNGFFVLLSGVLIGSVRGTLLFMFYINDHPKNIK